MECKATNRAGRPCKAKAMPNGYCYRHNPDIPQRDKLEASKRGGLKLDPKALAETAKQIDTQSYEELLEALQRNINDLRQGKIDVRTSNALVQNMIVIIELKKVTDLNQRLTTVERKLMEAGL